MTRQQKEYRRYQYLRHLVDQADAAERDLQAAVWHNQIRKLAAIPRIWALYGTIHVAEAFYEKLKVYYTDVMPSNSERGPRGLRVYGKLIEGYVALKPE